MGAATSAARARALGTSLQRLQAPGFLPPVPASFLSDLP